MPSSHPQPAWNQALVLATRHPGTLTTTVRLRLALAPEVVPPAGSPAGRTLLGLGYAAIVLAGGVVALAATEVRGFGSAHLGPAVAFLALALLGSMAMLRLMTRRAEIDRLDAAAERRWSTEVRDSEGSTARLVMRRSYLAVLGLSDPTSASEIRRAYRGIAMLYHPDLNPGDRSAAELFQAATAARNMLLGGA